MGDLDLQVVDMARQLLVTAILISGPMLMVGLVVGVSVSLFQALTSVQEQTLSLVPKMLAVFSVALLMLAPALGILRDYCLDVLNQMNTFGLS
ncbi:MAG: flagellar biosynthetic protein FliQ [Planctomycetota bacterium]|jgi:flagellar biosynthetic protein FliQ